jgi:hypothetical protein
MKYKFIVAIDPSVNLSGVCVYNLNTKEIEELSSKRIWEIFQDINLADLRSVYFFVENSNLDKRNWHGASARGNVGKNKGISQNIVDYLREVKASFEELKPDGYSLKFASSETFISTTGCTIRSNKDNRAAAAMIYFNSILVKYVKQL